MNPTLPLFDRTSEDVGNLVELGHVNLRVPSQAQALAFYVMGLGLTRDPQVMTGTDNAWVNAGTSQFHLPVGPAQVLRGTVGLVLPDLGALLLRLEQVAPRLAGTAFAFVQSGAHRATQVDVTCPWGNRIRVHAPDAARFGRMQLGMPYVEVDVAPGTAERIARFYAQVLAAPARSAPHADGALAQVPVGPQHQLLFRETRRKLPAYDGHHVQVTVADFSGVHRRLLERGLVTRESDQSEYRFQDIIDLGTGAVLTTLEHEVRSMRHPQYGRPLHNQAPGGAG